MAKQRNSLGICVLPEPGVTPISWEEYQNRYGIDLSKIFLISTYEDGGETKYKVSVNPRFTKLIAISSNGNNAEDIAPIAFPNGCSSNPSSLASSAYFSFDVVDSSGSYGHYINFRADKMVNGGGENE